MWAVRIHGERDLRLEDLPDPVPGAGMVILTGGFTGICGTDIHLYYAPSSYGADFSQPAALTDAVWPQILGHEFSGVVAEVGPDVSNVRPGDRVAVFPYHSCGVCWPCRAGHDTDCELMTFDGIQGRSGGLAQRKLIAADQCFRLPDGVNLELGALVEPMAVGWHAVEVARLAQDDSALIVGGGPIGIGVFFALRAKGVWPIIVSEPSETRREILRRVGVEILIDPLADDLFTRVRAVTSGAGVTSVIDTAGSPQAFVDAMRCLAVGGSMVTIAIYERAIPLTRSLLAAGRSIRSSAVYTRDDFCAVIDAMDRGSISLKGDWVHYIDVDDIDSAIAALRTGASAKVLVRTPKGDSAN